MAHEEIPAETYAWDVIGLGCTAVDEMLYLPGPPPNDGRMRVERSERRCGGLTANALIAAARLGARCTYVGALGGDPASDFVRAALSAEGIDVSNVPFREDARPVQSRILVDTTSGSRTILYEISERSGIDEEASVDVVGQSRVVVTDQFGSIPCAEEARRVGIPVVADLDSRDRPGFEELLRLSDHLILGEEFALAFTGAPDASEAVRRLWNAHPDAYALLAVTVGERGCWYLSREASDVRLTPAYAVKAIDTTGCGDIFHGAYAAALAQGLATRDCLDIASAAAALKASTGVIPGHAAVAAFRAENLTGRNQNDRS